MLGVFILCMHLTNVGYGCSIKDTLQKIASTKMLWDNILFQSTEQQIELEKFLKSKNADLYINFCLTKRTLIIRDTGDNFRAASRYPTEQTSYSVLNLKDLVSCPYGQFISTLWRGKESRKMLQIHAQKHYNELCDLVKNGINLNINGLMEEFNVILIFVADLSFTKEILGKCSSTQTFGCFHCELNIKSWSTTKKIKGNPQSIIYFTHSSISE